MRARLVGVGVLFSVFAIGCLPGYDAGPMDPAAGAPDSTGATGGGTGGGGGDTTGTTGGGTGGSDDAGVAPSSDAASPVDAAGGGGDLAINCINLTTATTSGRHNAGEACLRCHSNGGGAPTFTAAGTLFSAVSGGKAVSGATIELTDANGKVVRIVTSQNGNFYTSSTLAFPVSARASGCPNDLRMASKATGDCNAGGCHTSTFQVHLP